ncbi:hypothetical protein D3C76_1591120 [compost metagenome]
MLYDDHEGNRHDRDDDGGVPLRGCYCRQCKPFRIGDGRGVHFAHEVSKSITDHDPDQDMNDLREAAEQDGAKYRNA